MKWRLSLLSGHTRPMYSVTGEKMSVEGCTSLMLRSRNGFAFKRLKVSQSVFGPPCTTIHVYVKIVECVKMNDWENISEAHPAWHLKKWGSALSTVQGECGTSLIVLNGERIFIPPQARSAVLEILHEGHPSVAKMTRKANQYYFWPGLNNECEQKVKGCLECAKLAPSQQKHILKAELALAPMSHVGIDLFSWQGKNYLVAVCRYSGWPFVKLMRSITTDSVCKLLTKWFNDFGWHELTSAYNAEANGLAEAAVKQTKFLLRKIGNMGERYDRELCAWRNTPRADGFSPARLMFDRNLKEERLPVAAPLFPCKAANK